MKAAKAGGWLPHEIAFVVFWGVTALRLFASGGFAFIWGLFFAGLIACVFSLRAWSFQNHVSSRQRIRLLAFVPLMLVSYQACGIVVPIFHPGATDFLEKADQWLLGQDAGLYFEKWAVPWLTDLFFALYLFFFVYLGMSLWDYGRGPLARLRVFISGLFTVYGLGFLGYTLLPAGGPYLEFPGHFSTPLAGSWITTAASTIVAHGTNRVDCFPCLHFAVSFFILVFDCWHCRRRFWWVIFPCLGIWISTIYLRQHYGVDLLGGLILASLALWLARPRPSANRSIEPDDGP